jgi:hypothetical protein
MNINNYRLVAKLGLLSAIPLAICSGQDKAYKYQPDAKPIDRSIRRDLNVSFQMPKGKLALCSKGGVLPIEAAEELCVIVQEKKDELTPFLGRRGDTLGFKLLGQLRGYVKIASPEDALCFVRLATSPATAHTIFRARDRYAFEVIAFETISDVVVFGDKEYRKRLSRAYQGSYGIIPQALAKELGFEEPKVVKANGGYEIIRVVVEENGRRPCLVKQTHEWVGPDGEYKLVSEKALDSPQIRAVGWHFPRYL